MNTHSNNPIVLQNNNKIVKILKIPENSHTAVTTLDVRNNDISYLDKMKVFKNLPELKILDISGNNNYIGFNKTIFSNNRSMERIVINNFYIHIQLTRVLNFLNESNNIILRAVEGD